MPASVEWRDASVPITAGTVVDGRGEAAATAGYVARTLSLKQGSRGPSRIRLAIVSPSKVIGAEAYHLRAAGNEVLIEASDPRGLFYGAQTLRQLVVNEP